MKFYKLMGCGKNGSFDINPDLNQWAVIIFFKPPESEKSVQDIHTAINLLGGFISSWWKLFASSKHFFLLEPYAGHGSWDGKSFVPQSNTKTVDPAGQIGVLTRATIRLSRLKAFWGAVPNAAQGLDQSKGFIFSVGIGEIPFIKQATFSVWATAEDMKDYAYKRMEHQEVIRRTRKENWYSEEMFLRFKVLDEYKDVIDIP
ncbi:MAG: DUF3291 domain-containing protein [bacterium]